MLTFTCTFEEETCILALQEPVLFDDLITAIDEKFSQLPKDIRVKFLDDEGDWITISGDDELDDAIDYAEGDEAVILMVVEGGFAEDEGVFGEDESEVENLIDAVDEKDVDADVKEDGDEAKKEDDVFFRFSEMCFDKEGKQLIPRLAAMISAGVMNRNSIGGVITDFIGRYPEVAKYALFDVLQNDEKIQAFLSKADEYLSGLDDDSLLVMSYQIPIAMNRLVNGAKCGPCKGRRGHHGNRGRGRGRGRGHGRRHHGRKHSSSESSSSEENQPDEVPKAIEDFVGHGHHGPHHGHGHHGPHHGHGHGHHGSRHGHGPHGQGHHYGPPRHRGRFHHGRRHGRGPRRPLMKRLKINQFDFGDLHLVNAVMRIAFDSIPEPNVHHGMSCSNCKADPIVGNLFMCAVCENVNLCAECEQVVDHDESHPLILMKTVPNKSLKVKKGLAKVKHMHKSAALKPKKLKMKKEHRNKYKKKKKDKKDRKKRSN